jgi:hypothetical protein
MERRWKHVTREYLVLSNVGMDPSLVMALANNISFIYTAMSFHCVISERGSEQCTYVWLGRELIIKREAASKSATVKPSDEFVSGIFFMEGIDSELHS